SYQPSAISESKLILRFSVGSDRNSRKISSSKDWRRPGLADLREKMSPICSAAQSASSAKARWYPSSKHSDNEQDDHYWCKTQHGNQSGLRHELSQPPPQRNLAHDSRNEHEGKQTKTEGWMIATWKAGAGFMRITIWFHFSRNTKEVYFG